MRTTMSDAPSNVVRLHDVNRELLDELTSAPDDVKHFMGTHRCCECGDERKMVQRVPLWAMNPPAAQCEACGAMACVFVDPKAEPDGGHIFKVILPEER